MAGLYIHIPFCHSKCAYCDFYSLPSLSLSDSLVDALAAEFALRRSEVAVPYSTVYIGGGTPSILSVSQLSKLIDTLHIDYDVTEFTFEANPEDINPAKVAQWRLLGINRISMGAQSFVDDQLSLIRRRHSADDIFKAVDIIRGEGFSNFSIDLIYGLPGQSLESWEYSLNKLFEINPTHFSAYMLTYEPKTRLTAMLKKGEIAQAPDELIVKMYNMLIEKARIHGYEHYEISNFCRPGYMALHNSSYWDSTPYLGLGPAAHSFDGKVRRFNPPDIKNYIECVSDGRPAFVIDEETKLNRLNDLIITSLRTSRGLDFSKVRLCYRRKFIYDAFPHLRAGNLISLGSNFIIPEDKWIISDSILADLIQV